ncbi:MAG: DJ-1/PfpI family protein [Desulfurococcales archaeon]|nr:DJ-1/PfpI family protein [Desulfurococcales archaeon]
MRALVIAEDDVDDLEFFYAVYRMLELGFEVVVAASRKYSDILVLGPSGEPERAPRRIRGKRGIEFSVDATFEEALNEEWDALVIPGGRGPERARIHREAVELTRKLVARGVPTLAICHGPLLLASAGVIRGRRVTGHPGIADDLRNAGAIYTGAPAEADGNIVTARHTTTIHEGFKLFVKLLEK